MLVFSSVELELRSNALGSRIEASGKTRSSEAHHGCELTRTAVTEPPFLTDRHD